MGWIALELEWNNKTEFYDRDLNNFRLLFDLRVALAGDVHKKSGPVMRDRPLDARPAAHQFGRGEARLGKQRTNRKGHWWAPTAMHQSSTQVTLIAE